MTFAHGRPHGAVRSIHKNTNGSGSSQPAAAPFPRRNSHYAKIKLRRMHRLV